MPSAFDKRFARSGFPSHKKNFGEPIVYFPRDGGQHPFDAVVDRNPPAFYGPGGDVLLPDVSIRFDNDCDTGRLASQVDQGDSVELLAELGDTKPTRLTVMKLMSQDGGVCTVMLKGD